MKQYATLDDTVYFWFVANDTAGSGGDGSSPASDVRLAGAAGDAAPVLSPIPVLLSHVNYPAGCYEIAIEATSGNGFAVDQTYAVFSTLLIDGQNPTGFVGSFDLKGVKTDVEAIADQVWDEVLTGATHNISTSAGKRLREVGAYSIHAGTAQAGTSCNVTLAVTADANNGVYNRNLLVLVGGKGVGQTRTIVDYDAATKIVVVDRDWRVTPDNTSEYQIVPDDTPLTVDHGRVREATANTIKIREYASGDDNSYLCNIISIITGKGRGQARLVGSYNGTTKVITLCGDDWVTIPDITSIYVMIPYGTTCTSCLNDNAITQIVAGIIAGIADGSYDLQEMIRIIFSACACKSTGGGTTDLKFRDGADGKDRIAATVDVNGNRTGIVLDGS